MSGKRGVRGDFGTTKKTAHDEPLHHARDVPPMRGGANASPGFALAKGLRRLERDEIIFRRSLEGCSIRAIAQELNVDRRVVARVVRDEITRRAELLGEDRDRQVALHLAELEHLQMECLRLAGEKGTDALSAAERVLGQIAQVRGILEPTRKDSTMATLLAAFDAVSLPPPKVVSQKKDAPAIAGGDEVN